MDKIITNKLYELIDEIEKSNLIKNLEISKKNMLEDKNVTDKIDKFNTIKQNENNQELFLSKKDLYDNDKVKEYLTYENELNYMIMDINKKLNSIIDKKGCR